MAAALVQYPRYRVERAFVKDPGLEAVIQTTGSDDGLTRQELTFVTPPGEADEGGA